MNKKVFKTTVGEKELSLEVSRLAEQANAAVLAKYGETVALVTVVMAKNDSKVNYLPLRVDYEERFYAAGKIIGSRFIRREGKPSEEAILAGRLVDRTIRPLFDHRIRRDIQVVVTILAIDEENDPEFVGLIGASAALAISDVPWNGPVAGVRVAKIGDNFKINPNISELKNDLVSFEAFVAGPKDYINMIELAGNDSSESDILEGFRLAIKEINKLIDFQEKIVREIGKEKAKVSLVEPDESLKEEVWKFLEGRLEEAIYTDNKIDYHNKLSVLKEELFKHLKEKFSEDVSAAGDVLFEEAIDHLVHKNILEKEKRPDGRKLDEIRALSGEVGLFKRTHGSALFVRGNTQVLAVTTLASPGQEQLIETMETTGTRRFLLHYNFPPYSVGEIGNFRGPGRREIGHGALAQKAIVPLLPSSEEFPYTIRVVSETLSSNGSSSMATVCAAALSLMDAGVPIKKLAAGIAMGLMVERGSGAGGQGLKFKVLTDIQGPEDHHGDMDFKVAGTRDGVNAIQMDVKVNGVNLDIIQKTLEQGRKARLQILDFMSKVLEKPRPNLSPYAPIILTLKINADKIGDLIGPGGKTIKGLIEKYGLVAIDVEDDGKVFISADSLDKARNAISEIKNTTRDFAIGEVVEGKIVKILEFGAIVDLGGGRDGMIHISELKNGYVKNVEDVVKVGDFVRAKIVRVEDGKVGLSLKQL